MLNRWMLSWILAGLMYIALPGVSVAQEETSVRAQVTLETIKKVVATESRGDELYFSVTEYSSIERPRTYLIPNFPTHWLSEHLEQLKNVMLWQKPLQDKESVMLVISLLERDAPPWNVDDLIGTVKLKLHFENGKVKQEWQIPNTLEVAMSSEQEHVFKMTGENGEYEVDLLLKAA